MAYLNNVFEQNPNAIPGSISALMKAIAPDYFAQQTFQQMAQQDPTLIERISNMDEGQRETFNQTVLGSRNKNPLAKIGIGEKRAERERITAARKNLTPDEAKSVTYNELGATSQDKINRQKVLEGQQDTSFATSQVAANKQATIQDQTIDLNKTKIKSITDEQKRIDEAVAANPNLQGIDIRKIGYDAALGRGNPQVITAIQQDPGANELFEAAKKLKLEELAHQYRVSEKLVTNSKTDRRVDRQLKHDETTALFGGWTKALDEVKIADAALKSFEETYPKAGDPKGVELQLAKNAAVERAQLYGNAYTNATSSIDGMNKALMEQEKNNANKPPTSSAAAIEARISSKALTLEQVLSSPSLTQVDRDYLLKKYGVKK